MGTSKYLQVLRSPDGDDGGGGGTSSGGEETGSGEAAGQQSSGGEGKAPTTPVLDMTTKVRMADGKEVSLGTLMQAREAATKAESERDNYKSRVDSMLSLFQEDTSPEQREQVTRQILSDAGYSTDEVEAYMEVVGGSGEQIDPTKEYGKEEGKDNGDGMSPEIQQEMAKLRKENEEIRSNQTQSRVRELGFMLEKGLDHVLDSNPRIKVLLSKATALAPASASDEDKRKATAKARASLKDQLKREALEKLNIRRSKSGTFEDSWMIEEIDRAVEPVINVYQSVIGDINKLGRSPETVTGGTPGRERLDRDPVPTPVWKAGDDNRKKLTDWANDSLERMAAEIGAGEDVV